MFRRAPNLSENIAYFSRTIKQVDCISNETLRQRTDQYLGWVAAYTRKNEIPMVWAQQDVRKKDDLAPLRMRMAGDNYIPTSTTTTLRHE